MAPTANRRPNRDMWVTTGGAPDSAACSGKKKKIQLEKKVTAHLHSQSVLTAKVVDAIRSVLGTSCTNFISSLVGWFSIVA